MLSVPAYREGWERKRHWYEERLGIPVVGDGVGEDRDVTPGTSPVVITSRDSDDGGIDAQRVEYLARSTSSWRSEVWLPTRATYPIGLL